jgi:signal transduction histidine kinase
MANILLFGAASMIQFTDILIWTVLVLIFIILIALIFWQRKVGRELADELAQLDKIEKHNIQNEFVLKALSIATWHMDVETKEVAYDNDFRERTNSWIADAAVTNGNINNGLGMLHEQDAARVGQELIALCEGKIDFYHVEYRVRIPNTDRVYWEESYATVSERNDDGSAKTIVGTSKRIDDRKNMEAALVDARYRAEESDRLKTAFLANMSHEIRTPLNAIVGFTSVLPDVQEPEERQTLLDLIHENTQKLLRIVDDVVAISKVEAGKDELDISNFDLSVTLLEIVNQSMPKVKTGVTMTTDFAVMPQYVKTDQSRLQETMRHLISNAIKFTDNGSIVVGYDEPIGGRIRIWVRDTGKGIAAEHRERIFERFFKVDEFIPGAGLGLSTCQAMAYSMGGSVTVESTLGEGSTFTFEIPIQ